MDPDAPAAAANAARDRGDVPKAIELYGEAVRLNPGWPDGWWFLGSLQYGTDQYAAARDALSRYIDLTPNAGPAFALRGLCEFETGQYPESLADLQHGIALGAANQPRNAQILLYHEALLLTRLGRFEEAIGKYGIFVKQQNVNDDVITAIGLTVLRIPKFPKEIDPTEAELVTLSGRAAIAVMAGDSATGGQAFADIFQRFPTTPNLHYSYGYLLFPTDPDQAVVQFQRELEVSPKSAIAYAMLAWGYGFRGNFTEALPNAEKAVAADPTLPMGQLVLGRAMVETGDVAGGMTHLQKALQMEPANLEAHLTLVKAFSKLGLKEDARRERLLCLEMAGQGAASHATP